MARASILSVGDELLVGDLADRNAAWIARELAARGHRVVSLETVGDRVEEVSAAVTRARARGELLLVTGGLGPTADDLTREGVAAALGLPLAPRRELEEELRAWAARANRRLAEGSLRQAVMPQGAEVLANPRGTAPGFRLRAGDFQVACFPGVPSEMRPMVSELLARLPRGEGVPPRRLLTCGLAESEVGERLGELMTPELAGCRVGVTASGGQTSVTVRGEDEAAVARAAVEAERRLGAAVVGTGEASLPGAVLALLAARGWTVTVAESCTGGLLAAALTSVSGSSAVFREGVVAYANEVKSARLGVGAELLAAQGAVSEVVACAMAEGARAATGADVALAITGVAGPDGGTPEKPVGTVWLALADARGTLARHLLWKGARDEIRARAVNLALDLLRRRLLED